MIYQYVVTLKNQHRATIDRFSILVCSVSSLLFLYAYLMLAERPLILLLGGIVVLGLTSWNLYQLLNKKWRIRFNYILMITGLVWAAMPFYPWLSIILLIMSLFEHQAKKDLEIGFADNEIVFNTLPRKRYDWSEFSNIILKDNLLTMDFTNNRLLQRETIDDDEDDCEEDEFNEYCRQQLKAE
jgi:hypothetical protein